MNEFENTTFYTQQKKKKQKIVKRTIAGILIQNNTQRDKQTDTQ